MSLPTVPQREGLMLAFITRHLSRLIGLGMIRSSMAADRTTAALERWVKHER